MQSTSFPCEASVAEKKTSTRMPEALTGLAARVREMRRWRPDSSTFSALGLDVAPSRSAHSGKMYMISSDQDLRSKSKYSEHPAAGSGSSETNTPDSDSCLLDSDADSTADEFTRSVSAGSRTTFHHARLQLLNLRQHNTSKPCALQGFGTKMIATMTPQSPPAGSPIMLQHLLFQQQMHQQMLIQRMHEDFSSQQWQAPLLPMHNKRIQGPLARSGDESSGLTDDSCRSLVRRQSSMSTATGENAVMKRSIQSLLNKVCPENVGTILQNVAALNVKETSHLEILVDLIFNKALAEPHYCETYADLAFGLTAVLPEFSRPAGQGGPAVTLRSVLLGACQREFENLLAAMDEQTSDMDPEEIDALRKSRRDRLRANTRLIGALFLRKLLATKVVGRLCCELTNCSSDQPPEEHAVECVCELLNSVGLTLESQLAGAEVIEQVCQRLKSLKDQKQGESKTIIYCKRIQFTIQDLLDTRGAGWSKISFKSAAKTKEEIRQQQERDEVMAKCSSNKHVVTPGAEKVLVGQRPSYLNFGAMP